MSFPLVRLPRGIGIDPRFIGAIDLAGTLGVVSKIRVDLSLTPETDSLDLGLAADPFSLTSDEETFLTALLTGRLSQHDGNYLQDGVGGGWRGPRGLLAGEGVVGGTQAQAYPPVIDSVEKRIDFISRKSGYGIFILNDRASLDEVVDSFGIRDQRVKYLTVIMPDGLSETRLCGERDVHVGLILPGDQIIAAGFLRKEDGRVRINGRSKDIPTVRDQAVFGFNAEYFRERHPIASESGLNVAARIMGETLGEEVLIEE